MVLVALIARTQALALDSYCHPWSTVPGPVLRIEQRKPVLRIEPDESDRRGLLEAKDLFRRVPYKLKADSSPVLPTNLACDGHPGGARMSSTDFGRAVRLVDAQNFNPAEYRVALQSRLNRVPGLTGAEEVGCGGEEDGKRCESHDPRIIGFPRSRRDSCAALVAGSPRGNSRVSPGRVVRHS